MPHPVRRGLDRHGPGGGSDPTKGPEVWANQNRSTRAVNAPPSCSRARMLSMLGHVQATAYSQGEVSAGEEDEMERVRRNVGIVLFEDFELLDVFGPVELLSRLPGQYALTYIAPTAGPVRSSQGIEVIATDSLENAATADIAMVPGGAGTRGLADDTAFLDQLATWASPAALITSVCTGSALLAAAGLLEGYRATSNKRAFRWAASHGTDVTWVPQARWVHDRDRWTSSGIAAGMDMTAALIGHISGEEAAVTAAREIELEVHSDPDWDPFATHYGLS